MIWLLVVYLIGGTTPQSMTAKQYVSQVECLHDLALAQRALPENAKIGYVCRLVGL